jgi:fumarate reductase subunit D
MVIVGVLALGNYVRCRWSRRWWRSNGSTIRSRRCNGHGRSRGNFWRLIGFAVLVGVVVLVISLAVSIGGSIGALAGGPDASRIVSAIVSSLLAAIFTLYIAALMAAIHRQLAGPTAEDIRATFE